MKFIVKREVLDLGLKCIGITITNIDNKHEAKEFVDFKDKAYKALKNKYKGFDIETDLILRGFTKLHKKIGIKRRKNTPINESILKRFLKDESLLKTSKLIEIYNIVTLDSRLPIGVYDIDKIDGNVTLLLAPQTLTYTSLEGEEKTVNQGEYVYNDNKDVLYRLEVEPSQKASITENTKNVFITIEGNEDTSAEYLMEVGEEIIYLITSYCGGTPQIIYKWYDKIRQNLKKT